MDIQKDTRAENLLDTEVVILLDDLVDTHQDTRPEDLPDIVAVISPAYYIEQEIEKFAVTINILIVMLGRVLN